jgi:hypothetical protein
MANEKDSFVRPLAEGLARMLTACGATPEIHYDGLEILSLPLHLRGFMPREIAGFVLKSPGYRARFEDLLERVRDADAVVVVAHVPASLSRRSLQNVEEMRKRLPHIPIVNYDLIYLPTVEKWSDAMLRGDHSDISAEERYLIEPEPFGMERYDWYLVGSPASELPMPPGPHPYSHIGVNVDDGTLYPAQGDDFHVLLDFEQTRKDYPMYRDVQVEALDRSGVSYEILEGRFTSEEIRARYREAGALMLAHRESFGLPIVEVQACGGQIFTPRAEWAGAHWMKDDLFEPGAGEHSSNFVVYENTVDALVGELISARDAFDPWRRLATFREMQPHLLHGDVDELSGFLSILDSRLLHSRLHEEHASVGS